MARRSTSAFPIFLLCMRASALVDPSIVRLHQSSSSTHRSPNNIHHPSKRRDFVGKGLVFIGFSSALILGHPGTAASAPDDPFAQVDLFASSMSTAKPSAPSPSKGDDKNETPKQPEASASALDAALEESRKRKRIDPRTHG